MGLQTTDSDSGMMDTDSGSPDAESKILSLEQNILGPYLALPTSQVRSCHYRVQRRLHRELRVSSVLSRRDT